MPELIKRTCEDCGEEFGVEIDDDGDVLDDGARFLGTFDIPVDGTGEYVELDYGLAADYDPYVLEFDVSVEEAEEWDEYWPQTEWTGEYEEEEKWVCGCDQEEDR